MPEMKKSGIAWVNDIPTSWKVHPIYAYFKERKATNASGKERNLLSLSYGRIVRKDIDSADGLRPASYITYNIVMPGDIVIRPTDLQNDKRSLRTGLVTQRGIITSAYIALAPTEKVYSPFFHYLLHSYDVMKVFYNMGSGVRQSLSFNDFAKLKVLVPPLAEQRRIADYLDERCGAIDEAKKSIEEEVDALRRLRVATIFRAVTKGLDDGVPMRDSGVQWVGAIPESWETPRFKNVYRLVKRTGYPEEELLSVYLNYGVIRFSDDDGVRVHKTSSDTSGYQLVLPGELVMNNQQAWRGSVGVSSLRGIVSPAYHVYQTIDSNVMNARYANYMFRSCMVPAYKLCSHGVGTIQRNISPEDFAYELIPLPPISEQNRIADYLDERCAAIDSVIDARTRQLERLEDYRKALIYAYATGKKEVPAS